MRITVLLVDDSEIVRKLIRRLLEGDPEIQLIAEARSFVGMMELMGTLQPEAIVMDLHIWDEKAVTTQQVRSCLAGSRVLAMSVWSDDETRALADSYGALICLDKARLHTELIPAIKRYGRKHQNVQSA